MTGDQLYSQFLQTTPPAIGYGAIKENAMGLFSALGTIASLPIRVAVDVVKAPAQLVNGEDFLENTIEGLNRIEKYLND